MKLEKEAKVFVKCKRRAGLVTQLEKKATPASTAKNKKQEAAANKKDTSSSSKTSQTAASKASQKAAEAGKASQTTAASKASPDKEPTSSKDPAGTEPTKTPSEPAQANLKFWEVSGLQVRAYKGWIAVRVTSEHVRKFHFKEWQNESTAKQVATEFARKASRTLLEYRALKTKTDKTAFVKEKGLTDLTGKETVFDMSQLLAEACYGVAGVPSRFV